MVISYIENMAHEEGLTSLGATGRCVFLSSSLSTSMYLWRWIMNKAAKTWWQFCSFQDNSILTYFSRMLSLSFWSANEEILFPWFTWGNTIHLLFTRGNICHQIRLLTYTKTETVTVFLCIEETHINRSGAELDIALYNKAHSFLHVSFGNRKGTAGLGQTTFGKHLQQVLLLGLPLGHWHLEKYTFILLNILDHYYKKKTTAGHIYILTHEYQV